MTNDLLKEQIINVLKNNQLWGNVIRGLLKGLDPYNFSVFCAIFSYDPARPSFNEIIKITGLSKDKVCKCIKYLCHEVKFFTVHNDDKRILANLYEKNFEIISEFIIQELSKGSTCDGVGVVREEDYLPRGADHPTTQYGVGVPRVTGYKYNNINKTNKYNKYIYSRNEISTGSVGEELLEIVKRKQDEIELNSKREKAINSNKNLARIDSDPVIKEKVKGKQKKASIGDSERSKILELIDLYAEQNIVTHSKTDKLVDEINLVIKKFNFDHDIYLEAIKNYSLALKSGKFTYKWSLVEFLSRKNSHSKFFGDNFIKSNYTQDNNNNFSNGSKKTSIDWETMKREIDEEERKGRELL